MVSVLNIYSKKMAVKIKPLMQCVVLDHEMLAVDRESFCKNMRAACIVIACRTIGDEAMYNKFIARQCLIKDQESIQLSNGIAFVDNIFKYLENIIQSLEFIGHQRTARVIRIMRESPTCEFGVVDMCSVCSLTGRMCASFIVLRTSECGILVDRQYKKLIHCIWVLWHIIDIETARVEEFNTTDFTSSLRTSIDTFLNKHAATDEELDCYYSAYVYVDGVMRELLDAS